MAENGPVALAALAVTAIVGIAAPIGTLVVTNAHDDNVLEREQAQTDRTELRQGVGRRDESVAREDVIDRFEIGYDLVLVAVRLSSRPPSAGAAGEGWALPRHDARSHRCSSSACTLPIALRGRASVKITSRGCL